MAPLSRLVLTAATLLLTSVSAQAVTRYRVTDLGDLPGGTDHSYALGINDAGQVVGVGNHRPSSDSAFLWTASRGMQNLGANFSAAVDINNAGQIVGERYFANQNQAFLWTASRGMQALPLTRALGINRTGQVVGSNDSGVSLWTASGGVKALGIFGDGEAINNAGQVVGWDRDGGAFLWTASRGLQHLGQLPGGSLSFAYDINDAGQVVGIAYDASDNARAFLWTASRGMQDLGALPKQCPECPASYHSAYGINNAGQVVGVSDGRGFVWTAEVGMQDLNALIDSPGTHVLEAMDINNLGQIAGEGYIHNKYHAVLLTPIPEPGRWALLVAGFGLTGLMVRCWRS